MSYIRYLDEIPAAEIREELEGRRLLREQGKCDYCRRPVDECRANPCQFSGRDP